MRKLTTGALTLAAVCATASAAVAVPPQALSMPLTCDDGNVYEVWVGGRGTFTAGHVVGSTTTLIPVAFRDGHGQLFDPEGNLVEEFFDEDVVRPGGTRTVDTTCQLEIEFADEDGTFRYTSLVDVRYAPPRSAG